MKRRIPTLDEFINESYFADAKINNIKPNKELENKTGFSFAYFYISTPAENIIVDFNNKKHILLWNMMIDLEDKFDTGTITDNDKRKLRKAAKDALGIHVIVGNTGIDCSIRLSKSNTKIPSADGIDGAWADTKKLNKII